MANVIRRQLGSNCFVLLLGLACTWPAGSRAQSAADDSEYNQLVHDAVSEYNAQNWLEALSLFKQAHARKPNARTLRGIGNAAFELRHYAESLSALRAALVNSRKPLSPADRKEVQRTIARVEHYVGTLRVALSPTNATLALDGVELDTRELDLDVGEHLLSARAGGYKDAELRVSIDGGKTRSVELALEPAAAQAEALAPGAPAVESVPVAITAGQPSASTGTSSPWLPWLVVGVSGAVAITGGVLFALGRSDASSVENAKYPANWSQVSSAYERAPVLSTTGAIAVGVGLAGVALGLYWALSTPHENAASAAHGENLRARVAFDGSRVQLAF